MRDASIRIAVDLTNPGQFFACCGLLELADRLWPEVEGRFESQNQFAVYSGAANVSVELLCARVIGCELRPLMPTTKLEQLRRLNALKADCKRQQKPFPQPEAKLRKQLNSERIASGFHLERPLNLRVDWWLVENCDGDHLKTWSGQQAIAARASDIRDSLIPASGDDLLKLEKVIIRRRDGAICAPLSFDSGRVGTAQDFGYSPDKVGQAITCCVWTEFLTLIALQRFALTPDRAGTFNFHAWNQPMRTSVAAIAARGGFPHTTGCEGCFRLLGRDTGNRYKAFQQATLTRWRSA